LGYECWTLTILYGQTHSKEINAAENVARTLQVNEHKLLELPEGMFASSALTGDAAIPLDREITDMKDIPDTYVPARNLIFLSIASGWAEIMGADAVFIGATAVDYSGYPDCRPEFMDSFERTVNLATKRGVEGRPMKIFAPLLNMTKDEIIKKGMDLNLDYGLTWSCYSGGAKACGRCDSCLYRLKGFEKLGAKDPIDYE
jgi:7-cyano-7-deazaguanine synthase